MEWLSDGQNDKGQTVRHSFEKIFPHLRRLDDKIQQLESPCKSKFVIAPINEN